MNRMSEGRKNLFILCVGNLRNMDIVMKNYEELILERERIAPTSFGNLLQFLIR